MIDIRSFVSPGYLHRFVRSENIPSPTILSNRSRQFGLRRFETVAPGAFQRHTEATVSPELVRSQLTGSLGGATSSASLSFPIVFGHEALEISRPEPRAP